jgi:hypothetical protein
MSVGLFPFNEVEKIKIKTKLIHSIVFTRAEAEAEQSRAEQSRA